MRVHPLVFSLLLLAALGACGDDDGGAVSTAGLACAEDLDCDPEGALLCARGFEVLAGDDSPDAADDADGSIGLMIPPDQGSCMPVEGCQADSDCPAGSACFLPLEGVDPSAYADAGFTAAELEAGRCLVPCEGPEECRVDDGFTCAAPLAAELAGIEGVATRTFCVPEPFADPCAPDASRNQPGTCTLTYALEASFEIKGTPLSAGDGVFPLGPGTLIVRVPSADGVAPAAEGDASVLCYDMQQTFQGKAGIFTSVRAYASSAGADALNAGSLADGSITWDACTYPADYCDAEAAKLWSPSVGATGPGCIEGYRSFGDVLCDNLPQICTQGQLVQGHNPQDTTWTQPLNSLLFSGGEGFDTVSMGGEGSQADASCAERGDWIAEKVEIPNDSPGSTWLSFTGTLVSTECTAP